MFLILDDDVVIEFLKEKEEDIEKSKPKEVDLTLPGVCPSQCCVNCTDSIAQISWAVKSQNINGVHKKIQFCCQAPFCANSDVPGIFVDFDDF